MSSTTTNIEKHSTLPQWQRQPHGRKRRLISSSSSSTTAKLPRTVTAIDIDAVTDARLAVDVQSAIEAARVPPLVVPETEEQETEEQETKKKPLPIPVYINDTRFDVHFYQRFVKERIFKAHRIAIPKEAQLIFNTINQQLEESLWMYPLAIDIYDQLKALQHSMGLQVRIRQDIDFKSTRSKKNNPLFTVK
eukprot:Awhi_evm1s10327